MDPNNAEKNPSTENPSSMKATSPNIAALIIRRKNPKVNIVIGKVRTMIIGRINAFTMPSKNAESSSVTMPAICKPGMITEAIQSPDELISKRNINPDKL